MSVRLLIGPFVPIPAPREVMESLMSIKVISSDERPSGFELRFALKEPSVLEGTFLLAGMATIPMVRVIVETTVNGISDVLIDGVVTKSDVQPGNGGATEFLVSGVDLTSVLDYWDSSGIPFPAMPAEARIALILAKYAVFGIIPLIVPSFVLEIPSPLDIIPSQKGTDLSYIEKLAKDTGYVFYIEPGPEVGLNKAYWGPRIKVGPVQPTLTVNMNVSSNVDSLKFSYNPENKTTPTVSIQSGLLKIPIPIPIPDVSPFSPPLGAAIPISLKTRPLEDTGNLSMGAALLKGLSVLSNGEDVVSADGSLDVMRYGSVLKPRRLVAVRGAGVAMNGLYYVRSVTSRIKKGEFKQDFQLSRNGLVSTISKVPI